MGDSGTTSLGTLTLAGNYAAYSFQLTPVANSTTAFNINLVAATPHVTGPQDPLVDATYVYAHNPAVAVAGLDASAWYNSVGWRQGANPDANFDTNYYLTQNPDVKAAGTDPLTHFETSG